MKTISVLIPCYNEEENVVSMSEALVGLFEEKLSSYDYEIIFIDNNSADNTKSLLRDICKVNKNIKAIFNAKNFTSSILHIMVYFKHQEIVQSFFAVIFRILWN